MVLWYANEKPLPENEIEKLGQIHQTATEILNYIGPKGLDATYANGGPLRYYAGFCDKYKSVIDATQTGNLVENNRGALIQSLEEFLTTHHGNSGVAQQLFDSMDCPAKILAWREGLQTLKGFKFDEKTYMWEKEGLKLLDIIFDNLNLMGYDAPEELLDVPKGEGDILFARYDTNYKAIAGLFLPGRFSLIESSQAALEDDMLEYLMDFRKLQPGCMGQFMQKILAVKAKPTAGW
ncbi:MAG: hypothetical protein ABIC04_00675 [Nanoarchaeota archaeon]